MNKSLQKPNFFSPLFQSNRSFGRPPRFLRLFVFFIYFKLPYKNLSKSFVCFNITFGDMKINYN